MDPNEPSITDDGSSSSDEDDQSTTSSEERSGQTVVYTLDVGQGDAKLIVTSEDERILVDAGVNKLCGELDRLFDKELPVEDDGTKRIDLFIATHLDKDHVLGLQELDEREYEIFDVMIPDPERFSVGGRSANVSVSVFSKFINTLNRHNISIQDLNFLNIGDSIERDEAELDVLSPPIEQETFTSLQTGGKRNIPRGVANANSVSLKVQDGEGGSTLLMGDIEDNPSHNSYAEDWLVKQHYDGEINLDATVLHAGHHGSNNATKDGSNGRGSFLRTATRRQ